MSFISFVPVHLQVESYLSYRHASSSRAHPQPLPSMLHTGTEHEHNTTLLCVPQCMCLSGRTLSPVAKHQNQLLWVSQWHLLEIDTGVLIPRYYCSRDTYWGFKVVSINVSYISSFCVFLYRYLTFSKCSLHAVDTMQFMFGNIPFLVTHLVFFCLPVFFCFQVNWKFWVLNFAKSGVRT